MTSRNDRRNVFSGRSGPLFAGLLAAVTIVSAGGCLTAQPVSRSNLGIVSEAEAKRDVGIDYLNSRRTAMAIRELRASLKLDPSDPQTHLWLGESFRRKGRTEEAEAYLRDAIRMADPDEDSRVEQAARLTFSALLSQMGRYEESLEHCEALSEDPTFSSPWRSLTNCGWALLQLGRTEEARLHFEEALDFFPRFGPALLNLGILQEKQGHTLAAIKTFERALGSGRMSASGLSEAHYRLGEIYVGLQRRDKAVEHFREATTESPYADWGTQSQAYLDLLR